MRGAMARTVVATMGTLVGVGCGPAPYALSPEEPVVVVVVPPAAAPYAGEPRAPAPAASPEDGWIPDLLPRFNPFATMRTLVGAYDCPQGRTNLTLRVVDARGTRVRAIFDFYHAPSDTAGQFLLAGQFDEHTGGVVFTPGAWIIHPDAYVTVPMVGQVSRDGRHFAGRIPAAGCGGFRLRAVQ
jgi:hypothetical protein